MKKIIAAAGAALIALGVKGTVCAKILFFREREAFLAVASQPRLEDFEDNNLTENNIVSFSGYLDSTTKNSAFSPGDIETGIRFSAVGANINELDLLAQGVLGVPSDVIGPSSFLSDLAINFTEPVSQAGFDLLADLASGTVEVKIFGDSGLLATETVELAQQPTFFGVIFDADLITKIVIANQSDTDFVGKLIDNVVFSSNDTAPNS
ncbi:MAG: hypothetical protein ACFB4I_10415 [Cyanophyceae cyanobacterium]